MFRPLLGHHQAFLLNHVIKTLRTLLGSQLTFAKCEMKHINSTGYLYTCAACFGLYLDHPQAWQYKIFTQEDTIRIFQSYFIFHKDWSSHVKRYHSFRLFPPNSCIHFSPMRATRSAHLSSHAVMILLIYGGGGQITKCIIAKFSLTSSHFPHFTRNYPPLSSVLENPQSTIKLLSYFERIYLKFVQKRRETFW